MLFYLKISCKDKKLLKKFLHFFIRVNSFPILLKSFPTNLKRKFVTVLKSPHVNKTAQEQFEYRIYSRHLLIRSFKPSTFFLLLKKLKNLSFPGINLEVRGLLQKDKAQNQALRMISPDNLVLKNVNHFYFSKKRLRSTYYSKNFYSDFFFCKKYIQLFDSYGEVCLKKFFTL